MFDFLDHITLSVRGWAVVSVFAVVAVVFVVALCIWIPYIMIRDFVLLRKGKSALEKGDTQGAFEAYKRLFIANFCDGAVYENRSESPAEKAIMGMEQSMAKYGAPAVFQQILALHREGVRLEIQRAKLANDTQKNQSDNKVAKIKEQGRALLKTFSFPSSVQPNIGMSPQLGLNQQPDVPAGLPAYNAASAPVLAPTNGLEPLGPTAGYPQNLASQPPIGESADPNGLPPLAPIAANPQLRPTQQKAVPQPNATGQRNPAPEKIKINCTCGKSLVGKATLRGKIVNCPSCGTALKIE